MVRTGKAAFTSDPPTGDCADGPRHARPGLFCGKQQAAFAKARQDQADVFVRDGKAALTSTDASLRKHQLPVDVAGSMDHDAPLHSQTVRRIEAVKLA